MVLIEVLVGTAVAEMHFRNCFHKEFAARALRRRCTPLVRYIPLRYNIKHVSLRVYQHACVVLYDAAAARYVEK